MADGGPSRSGAKIGAATPHLDIEIVRQSDAWDRAKIGDDVLSQAAMAAFVGAAPRMENGREVALLLTGDAEMQALNRQWRGKDTPTNVLSFPSGEEQGHLGDVVLAYETVEGEAKQQNIAIADHAAHLVVHGMLHLLGYDHEQEDDALKMETLETEILTTLGIADPYGNGDSAGLRKVSP
jgi:probable rRNA maturation factor